LYVVTEETRGEEKPDGKIKLLCVCYYVVS
jgi:hypothetical protein